MRAGGDFEDEIGCPRVRRGHTQRIYPVASVPAGHVYVRHLSAPSGRDTVVRLADPVPRGKIVLTGQWWPPVMLSPSWVLDHHDEFDVFHIQFGFDAQEASCLSELARALRSVRKPLVYTVHDCATRTTRTVALMTLIWTS